MRPEKLVIVKLSITKASRLFKMIGMGLLSSLVIACGGSSGDSSANNTVVPTSTETTTAPVDTVITSQPSCAGSRIWGPLVSDAGIQLYVSETNGFEVPRCTVVWEYDSNRNCIEVFLLAVNESVGLTANGNALFTIRGSTFELPSANFSLQDIAELPDCESLPEDSNPSDPPVNQPSNGGNSNGASFGVDLPAYQDLILVSASATTFGLDGLLLATIEQTPHIRFADGTIVRDLDALVRGQNAPRGTWRVGSGGEITVVFNGSVTGSGFRPDVAPRNPQNFFYCFRATGGFSTDGFNALSIRDFCFGRDGTFSNNASGSFVGGGAIGSAQSDAAGTYEVEGNVIRLRFNNGATEVHIFGTYPNSQGIATAISIGGVVYYNRED